MRSILEETLTNFLGVVALAIIGIAILVIVVLVISVIVIIAIIVLVVVALRPGARVLTYSCLAYA